MVAPSALSAAVLLRPRSRVLEKHMATPPPSYLPAEMLAQLFEQLPIALSVYDHTGLQVASNAATAALWNIRREQWVGHFNMITDPQLAAIGAADHHRRVMAGETLVLPASRFSGRATGLQSDAGEYRWIQPTYAPLRDAGGEVTHLLAILQDVTEAVDQEAAIEAARAEISSQRDIIDALSSPVVTLWHSILLLPLVGAMSRERTMKVTESLLNTITEQQAECVIIDITGVPVVDTQIAHYLIQAAHACRLLGCEVVLVGIGSEIAQTLVQAQVDLSTIMTLANLQAGIAWAFARLRLRVVEGR
jgi:rsbT co-antagonist protein RsbR